MKKKIKCEYCGSEFISKRKGNKYCGLNCRVKAHYHKENPDAKNYVKGRTKEEKRKLATEYCRKRYNEDEDYRELQKMRRMIYYYKKEYEIKYANKAKE